MQRLWHRPTAIEAWRGCGTPAGVHSKVVAVQILVLGLVHVASCAVIYTGVGTGARLVLRARPMAARALTRCSGAAMIVIGVVLLIEQLVAR